MTTNRRMWLQWMASLGAAGASGWLSRALAKGDLPGVPGVNYVEGTAKVNGKDAKVGTPVNMGDRVATGRGSQAVILVGSDAFLLRSDTEIQVQGKEGLLSTLAVGTGKVLSVFSKKPVVIKAASATIGIRGTGAYLEVAAAEAYFCLCYGEAMVEGPGAPAKLVQTRHHEQPLLLTDDAGKMRVEPGKFRDHKDDELILLEKLCGREPPFVKDGTYPANKY